MAVPRLKRKVPEQDKIIMVGGGIFTLLVLWWCLSGATDSHLSTNDSLQLEKVAKMSQSSAGADVIRSGTSQEGPRTGLPMSLWEGQDLKGDSSTATVMGMASGYDLKVYERFVGTLRKSGYKGHIILGVAPDVGEDIKKYFAYRNVEMKILQWEDCTYRTDETDAQDIFKKTTCAHPYPDIKIRWSRFPLARDWLKECETCTGPVLVTDVRDAFFQKDPFGPGSPVVKGLQVFEEHKNQTTSHWLTSHPFKQCKGIEIHETMLCSGTTIGTREAMIQYLEDMYNEMKMWINDPKCRFNMEGDDQSIHNYLYYTGRLPYATAFPNRHGGIVNTVGVEGSVLRKMAGGKPYPGAEGERWIGAQFNFADDQGYFTEFDGSRSRVVHQFDRLGAKFYQDWMGKHKDLFEDPVPESV